MATRLDSTDPHADAARRPEESLWAAVVLHAVRDAFDKGDAFRIELDRVEALRFLLTPRGAWAKSREHACYSAGVDPERLHEWALKVMDGKIDYGQPKEVQASRDLWAAINSPPRKAQPTQTRPPEREPEEPSEPVSIPLPSVVGTVGIFDVREDGMLYCPNDRALVGPSLPRENSQQGRVLRALTMKRGGTINALRKAHPKWEQLAVEVCRRLDLEMTYRHDGHEVAAVVDADTKVFVRRRLPRAA